MNYRRMEPAKVYTTDELIRRLRSLAFSAQGEEANILEQAAAALSHRHPLTGAFLEMIEAYDRLKEEEKEDALWEQMMGEDL